MGSRDEFNERKGKDGFIALSWRFSNNMQNYLFGRDIEESKQSIFEWVVNNVKDDFVNKYFPCETLESNTWQERYKEYAAIAKNIDDFPFARLHVEVLERINRIDGLSNSDKLNIGFTNGSYEDYEHKEGDVVYCDIPYESTYCNPYKGFDNKAFYDWCYTRDYQVFFSSYDQIPDSKFYKVWERKKIVLCVSLANSHERIESIYSNMPYKKSLLGVQQEFEF